tara:strand:+ start:726 stop:1784 length:1059 start_codon:yes stop_codon:yes gene_type:complete
MQTEIKILSKEIEHEYQNLLDNSTSALFSHSLKFKNFLSSILKNAKDKYLCLYINGELEAAVPIFIKGTGLGSVVNSLPYYGNHGGIIRKSQNIDSVGISPLLLNAINDLCEEINALSCTLVESPFDSNDYYQSFGANLYDERVCQVAHLPKVHEANSYDDTLLHSFHQKTRNIVRKSFKGEFTVRHDGKESTLQTLHEIHTQNILAIEGKPKNWSAYKAIKENFVYDEDYRVYYASKEGEVVAALLVFYFKETVEYFTPVIKKEYRSQQPLSLLIFQAMRDAVLEKEMSRWNWGGTWMSQKGVYHFKSRWGSVDYPYKYHIKTFKNLNYLKSIGTEELLSEFQDFYIYPFN